MGPDWKPRWEGAGTIISNHINGYHDVLASMVLFYPAFVSRKSIMKWPGIGPIAAANDSIFLDRVGTKEEKIAAIKAIEARQKENEEKGRPPLHVFPEGATTNGEYLLKFKKGPFSGFNSVQPVCYKY